MAKEYKLGEVVSYRDIREGMVLTRNDNIVIITDENNSTAHEYNTVYITPADAALLSTSIKDDSCTYICETTAIRDVLLQIVKEQT